MTARMNMGEREEGNVGERRHVVGIRIFRWTDDRMGVSVSRV